jgi:hypothetical protein
MDGLRAELAALRLVVEAKSSKEDNTVTPPDSGREQEGHAAARRSHGDAAGRAACGPLPAGTAGATAAPLRPHSAAGRRLLGSAAGRAALGQPPRPAQGGEATEDVVAAQAGRPPAAGPARSTATPGKGRGSLPIGNPDKGMAAERKEGVGAERDGDRDSERASTLLFMAATRPKAEYRIRARRRLVLQAVTI